MDNTTSKFSNLSRCQQFNTACSSKSCCYFLLSFLVLFLVVPGVTVLIAVVLLKPQKPIFSIQTVKLESYKFDGESETELFVSSLLSFNLSAVNPNKVGLSYSTSRLHVLDDGITIGMIRVPRFYQPPKSQDISVPAQVIFRCVNVSKILSGKLMQDNTTNSLSQMRILGDVRAQVRIPHLPLPKFRVAMECDISIDRRHLITSLNANFKNQMVFRSSLPMTEPNQTWLWINAEDNYLKDPMVGLATRAKQNSFCPNVYFERQKDLPYAVEFLLEGTTRPHIPSATNFLSQFTGARERFILSNYPVCF